MYWKHLHKQAAAAIVFLLFVCPLNARAANWQLSGEGAYLTCTDTESQTLARSRFITVGEDTYYFDSDGFAHTGWLKLGHDYYFFRLDGTMVKKQLLNGYYFLADGKMARNRFVGKSAYAGRDGLVITGYTKKVKAKFITTSKGIKYRNENGTYSAGTWQCIKGNWYYFYSTGYMAVNRQIGKFYVDRQGRMVTSKWVKTGKMRYYYGSDGRLRRKKKA